MGISAIKLLRTIDDFGHPIRVNFKGEEHHQTACGGFLTIGVRIFIIIAIVKAATEVYLMQDPVIKSLTRPLSLADREEIGEIEFSSNNYFLGFSLEN